MHARSPACQPVAVGRAVPAPVAGAPGAVLTSMWMEPTTSAATAAAARAKATRRSRIASRRATKENFKRREFDDPPRLAEVPAAAARLPMEDNSRFPRRPWDCEVQRMGSDARTREQHGVPARP